MTTKAMPPPSESKASEHTSNMHISLGELFETITREKGISDEKQKAFGREVLAVVAGVDDIFKHPKMGETTFITEARTGAYAAYNKFLKGLECNYPVKTAMDILEAQTTLPTQQRLTPQQSYTQATFFKLVAEHRILQQFTVNFKPSEDEHVATEEVLSEPKSKGLLTPYLRFLKSTNAKYEDEHELNERIEQIKTRAEVVNALLFLSTVNVRELNTNNRASYELIANLNSEIVLTAIKTPDIVENAFNDVRGTLRSKLKALAPEEEIVRPFIEREIDNLELMKTGLNAEVYFYHVLNNFIPNLNKKTLDSKSYEALHDILQTSRITVAEKTGTDYETEANSDWLLIRETHDTPGGKPTKYIMALFDIQTESRDGKDIDITTIYKTPDGVQVDGDQDTYNTERVYVTAGTAERVLEFVNRTGLPVMVIKVPTGIVGPGQTLEGMKEAVDGMDKKDRDIMNGMLLYSLNKTLYRLRQMYSNA